VLIAKELPLRLIYLVSQKTERTKALKKCKECGNEVSTKAESGPKCGAVLKTKTGCLGYIGAVFLILIILGVIGFLMEKGTKSPTSFSSRQASTSKEVKIYKEGETVLFGIHSFRTSSYFPWQY
jgi:hypothetical protein